MYKCAVPHTVELSKGLLALDGNMNDILYGRTEVCLAFLYGFTLSIGLGKFDAGCGNRFTFHGAIVNNGSKGLKGQPEAFAGSNSSISLKRLGPF